jgi:hypothetical protein
MEPLIFEPNQSREYHLELDMSATNRPSRSKDWSVTAWGENGEITITMTNKDSATGWG